MPKKPLRNIRVPEPLWVASMEAAVRNGESVTGAINAFLIEYSGFTPDAPDQSYQSKLALARRQEAADLAAADTH